MDLERTQLELNRTSLPQYIKFVAESNNKTCLDCQRWDGKIFDKNAPNRPVLPLHPNCRCKYQDIPANTKISTLHAEKQHTVAALVRKHNISTEQAESLAEQILIAKMENKKLDSESIFLIFNGRYLASSDGSLMLNAVSGKPVSEKHSSWSPTNMTGAEQTVTRIFNYSYERQGIKNTGGIPEGLYYILQSETRSIITSPVSHFFGRRGWGSYSWSLHPCENTNTRERSGFFIHGGSESTSAGCIDLREHDITFNSFLYRSAKKKLYIYIRYPEENVSVSEKNMVLPTFNPGNY